MAHFLNTEEPNSPHAQYANAFASNPDLIYAQLCNAVSSNCIEAEAKAILQSVQSNITDRLRMMLGEIDTFEKTLPPRQSIFRGEDSKEIYALFCTFLMQLEDCRMHLREAVASLSEVQANLHQKHTQLTKSESVIAHLLHNAPCKDSDRARLTALIEQIRFEINLQTKLQASAQKNAAQIRDFDRKVLMRFFRQAKRLSDAQNGGASCSRTDLLALNAALKAEINVLLQKSKQAPLGND